MEIKYILGDDGMEKPLLIKITSKIRKVHGLQVLDLSENVCHWETLCATI